MNDGGVLDDGVLDGAVNDDGVLDDGVQDLVLDAPGAADNDADDTMDGSPLQVAPLECKTCGTRACCLS